MTDEELIDLIYGGLQDRSKWQLFLDAFRARLRGGQAIFIQFFEYPAAYSVALFSSSEPQDWDVLNRRSHEDPWILRVDWPNVYPGEFKASQDICPDEELEATAFYREILKPRDWHYGGGLFLGGGSANRALISMLRSKDLGPLNAEEIVFFRSFGPHLMRAVRIHDEQVRLKNEAAAAKALADAAGAPLVLMDGSGRIRLTNVPAAELMARRNLIWDDGGRVKVKDAAADGQLRDALARMGRADAGDARVNLVAGDASSGETLWLTLTRLNGSHNIPLTTEGPAFALRVVDPARRPMLVAEPLQKLWGLTPAEAHVAMLLTDGLSVDDVAERTGVAVATVRTHVKRVLQKMGLNRQPELVAQVLRVAGPA